MKHFSRIIVMFLVFLMSVFPLSACSQPSTPEPTSVPVISAEPTDTPEMITPTPTSVPTDTTAATITASPTATATLAPTPSPTPEGPRMYSSYADLVSFDPATGIAKFDYFDMLRGQDAIDFLVSNEGYSQADAEELVENFADSEYVEKNTNPQLRSIDLDDVSLKLMVQPSGDPVEDAISIPSTASDFRAIYALDPDLLLNSYFYYITVESDGHVSLVEQVYWP